MPPDESVFGARPLGAIVTGASRGIGLAISEALADAGLSVLGACRSGARADLPPREKLAFAPLDLASPASIEAFVRAAPVPDILINNAGQSQIGAAEDTPLESLRALFEVNFFGTVDLTRRLLPAMRTRARDCGRNVRIVNIGSLARAFPVPFQSSYVASKAALAGYTACLRREVRDHGIDVCLIEPADIRTAIASPRLVPDDSVYRSAVQTMSAGRDRAMQAADPPEAVVRLVLKIVRSRRATRPVYAVGGHAPLLCFLRRLLPGRLVEKLVARRYGLR